MCISACARFQLHVRAHNSEYVQIACVILGMLIIHVVEAFGDFPDEPVEGCILAGSASAQTGSGAGADSVAVAGVACGSPQSSG